MEKSFKANNFMFKSWTLKNDRVIIGSNEIMLKDIISCEYDNAIQHRKTSSGSLTIYVEQKSLPYYLTTRAGIVEEATEAFTYIINHSSDEEYKKQLKASTEEHEKFGVDDYYMECSFCNHIFHYTRQDLINDAKVELEAAKEQMWGGVNMVFGNAYMGKNDVNRAEDKMNAVPDRSKCPKCGGDKLTRITESEAKAKMNQQNVPSQTSVSSADELKKFKDLLDSGVITQEEFDAKKKQLLGL